MIRLIALDIDGTVLDSEGHVPAENRDAIARALAAGVEVALATGRRYDFARPVVDRLPGPLTLILSNGAVVKDHGGKTLVRRLLPRDTARHVLASAPAHRESAAIVFDRPREQQVVFERIDWEHPHHRRFFEANRAFLWEQAPLEDALTEDPLQVMFTGRCAEMRQLFVGLRALGAEVPALAKAAAGEPALVTASAGPPFTVALTEYLHRDFSLVDVTQPGCTKGSTLGQWADTQGYRRDEIMAVGDNLNDLEMLELAGCPVVMGNAIDELKARGWPLTATNDEAGVARAIETFVLVEAS